MISLQHTCAIQQDTKALQVSRGPPRKSRTVKGETADYIGLSLTLPKLYLATLEVTNKKFKLRKVNKRLIHESSLKLKPGC